MRRYHIYRDRSSGAYEAIKTGFSWPAALFGPIWACERASLGLAFGLFTLVSLAGLVTFLSFFAAKTGLLAPLPIDPDLASRGVAFAAFGAVALWCGANGSQWRVNSMERRGLVPVASFVELRRPTPESIRRALAEG